jgi:hypothetical protein
MTRLEAKHAQSSNPNRLPTWMRIQLGLLLSRDPYEIMSLKDDPVRRIRFSKRVSYYFASCNAVGWDEN